MCSDMRNKTSRCHFKMLSEKLDNGHFDVFSRNEHTHPLDPVGIAASPFLNVSASPTPNFLSADLPSFNYRPLPYNRVPPNPTPISVKPVEPETHPKVPPTQNALQESWGDQRCIGCNMMFRELNCRLADRPQYCSNKCWKRSKKQKLAEIQSTAQVSGTITPMGPVAVVGQSSIASAALDHYHQSGAPMPMLSHRMFHQAPPIMFSPSSVFMQQHPCSSAAAAMTIPPTVPWAVPPPVMPTNFAERFAELEALIVRGVHNWTLKDVAKWANIVTNSESNGERFVQQEIDGTSLVLLSYDQLQNELKFKLGPAVKLNNALNALKATLSNL